MTSDLLSDWGRLPRGRGVVRAALLGVFLALGGCGDPGVEVDPAQFAGEGWGETLTRTFSPRGYWQEKVAALEAQVAVERAHYEEKVAAYRQLLAERRAAMARAGSGEGEGVQGGQGAASPRTAGQENGSALRHARKEVMLAYRERVGAVRQENRQLSKQLRQRMLWLHQARNALVAAGGVLVPAGDQPATGAVPPGQGGGAPAGTPAPAAPPQGSGAMAPAGGQPSQQ